MKPAMTLRAVNVHRPPVSPGSSLLRLRSDETLVARFRSGDADAYTAIVARYRERLIAYARRVLCGSDDAEDVIQDVFLRAHRALLADDRAMTLKPWLYRIAHNRCMDLLRRPLPQTDELSDEHPSALDVPGHAQAREEFDAIVADIGGLPDQQRSALLIRELEGLSYEDLAATPDTTVGAVKSLLVRARVNLAEAAEARAA